MISGPTDSTPRSTTFHDTPLFRSFAVNDPLEVQRIGHLRRGREDLAVQLDLADAESPAAAGRADPSEEEAQQLPQGVEPEAARHYRVGFEMAFEEPQIGADIEFGLDLAPAAGASLVADARDPVEHQHGRQRQPRVAFAEQFTVGAFEEVFVGVAVLTGPDRKS